MDATFKVYRYDPAATGAKPGFRSYGLDLPDNASILDGLVKIREELDDTLAFRASCNRGFCGECVVRVNRGGRLACLTRAATAKDKNGEITVEPVRNVTVLKDLVYDVDKLLWQKIKRVRPWLQAGHSQPGEQRRVNGADLAAVRNAMRCHHCGLCDEGCSVIPFDKSFLGPAALTKGYRFVSDPRDGATSERLRALSESGGMWDCVHCFEADEHCPRGIDPTKRILDLRDTAAALGIKSGTNNAQVARHYDSFLASVKRTSGLDEARLAIETYGVAGAKNLAGAAWRAFKAGKLTMPFFAKKRPGADAIARIIDKVEAKNR